MSDWQEVADLHTKSKILSEIAIGHLNEVIMHLENVSLQLEKTLEKHNEVKREVG